MFNADRAHELTSEAIKDAANAYLNDVVAPQIVKAANDMKYVCNIKIDSVVASAVHENALKKHFVVTPLVAAIVDELDQLGYNVSLSYLGDTYTDNDEIYIDFGYIISWME